MTYLPEKTSLIFLRVLLSIVECVEEFICTCNVSISTELDQLFTQTFYEYYTSCKNGGCNSCFRDRSHRAHVGEVLEVPEIESNAQEYGLWS